MVEDEEEEGIDAATTAPPLALQPTDSFGPFRVASVGSRLASQSPQEEKVARADVVIDGSAPMGETRRQVERALATLRSTEG